MTDYNASNFDFDLVMATGSEESRSDLLLEKNAALKAELAAVTKELAHWKAGHLDSHAAEVATLRTALAACQKGRAKAVEALEEAVQSIKGSMRAHYWSMGKEYLAEKAIEENDELKRYIAIIVAHPAAKERE